MTSGERAMVSGLAQVVQLSNQDKRRFLTSPLQQGVKFFY
jgi:hypothetical protein